MREKLQTKLKALQTDRAQAQANLNAFDGAILIIQQLIAELDAEAKVSASSNGSEVTSGISTSGSSKV